MREVKPYKGESKAFLAKVIKSKRNKELKARLRILEKELLSDSFDKYDKAFKKKSLYSLDSCELSKVQSNDLLELYNYRRKAFQDLKISLTTDKLKRILNTCQNCTINEINSFDHVLPKSEFEEFGVHPRNLFPSCTTCNSKKSTIQEIDGEAQFLNLYLDKLPKKQFLFVTIENIGETIKPTFYLDSGTGTIDSKLFAKIENHYSRLDLLNRFSINSYPIISELANTIFCFWEMGRRKIVDHLGFKIDMDKKYFGDNFWKSILEKELLLSDLFWDHLQERVTE